jgi:hypothetical protein
VLGAVLVVAGAVGAEPHAPSVQVAVVVALGLQSAVHAAPPFSTLHEDESEGSGMPVDRAIAGRAVPSAAPITNAVTKAAIVCLRFIGPPRGQMPLHLFVAGEATGLM